MPVRKYDGEQVGGRADEQEEYRNLRRCGEIVIDSFHARMAGCCVPGCSNSTTKGFSLRSFPTNRERRERWIASIGVPNWEPSVNSRICEAHFAENMWEKDRCDGKRKLKCNAVPTIFPPHPVPHDFPTKPQNRNEDNDVVNMLIASLTDDGEVKINFQYQLHSDDIERLKHERSKNSPSRFASANGEETDWKKRCEELARLLAKSESERERLRDVMKRREELFNRIIRKSYKCGKILKKRLRKLREENRTYDKLKIRLGEIFNEDQIKALANQGVSCREWSDETIKRAVRLRLTCGSVGYQQILEQNIPLPSERTLRRKMNNVELNEDA